MRPLTFILVAAAIATLEANPAAAGRMSSRHNNFAFHRNNFAFHHAFTFAPHRAFIFNSRNGFTSSFFAGSRRFDRFHTFGFGTDGFIDWPVDSGGAPASVVVVVPPAPTAPVVMSRSEDEEHPTVETTASGVLIIRGPGSHRLAR